ncbi:hypothetical protein A9Q84_01195 [Halobacteriovorax marinus]|uniref:Outer membrane lipoprotein carrier protein LolA n=1 Tax=Halobacteriovorax marinus TaxID=97084 RepID=A0A1Y5FC25_9BACT|nr:hypothetical protein A9Q84_01195 [Halobacteriovorax marinus]
MVEWKKYEKIKSIKSDFNQIKYISSLDMSLTSKGKLSFIKPHYFEWKLDSPGGMRFVFDKEIIFLYEKGKKAKKIDSSIVSKKMLSPIKHLKGWLKLDLAFITAKYSIKKIKERTFEFTPKDKKPLFKKIHLTVGRNQPIEEMKLFEHHGDKITFIFKNSLVKYEK